MGYTTDFLGHFTITPALGAAEVEYLTAFSESRRWARPEGPYAVPVHPRDDGVPADAENRQAYNDVASGQPSLWCDWVPCPQGCCLSWSGREKFYEPTRWLTYLIEHFLAADGAGSRSDDPELRGFTFDHRLDGVVAACRRDSRRLWTIEARANEVTEKDLVRGDDEWRMWGPFPYEVAADRWSRPRRRRVGSVGQVVSASTQQA